MELKSEYLPCEAEEILAKGEKRVKLVFVTSHSIPKLENVSLFQNAFPEPENEGEPMPDAPFVNRQDMIFDMEPTEEVLVSEYVESDGDVQENGAIQAAYDEQTDEIEAEIYQLLVQLLDEKNEHHEEDPDRTIFRCEGVMSLCDGSVVIRYEEDKSTGMGETQAEIVLHGGRRDMVSIVRMGSVANTLVCEKGRRHISAYNTPIMPFQICVFTKECEHNVTLESGGTIYMNYYVELRGTEMQHTKMRITVKPM